MHTSAYECILEFLVFVNYLDAMLVASAGGLVADGREMAVHDGKGICKAPRARTTTIRPGDAMSCNMANGNGQRCREKRKGVKKIIKRHVTGGVGGRGRMDVQMGRGIADVAIKRRDMEVLS